MAVRWCTVYRARGNTSPWPGTQYYTRKSQYCVCLFWWCEITIILILDCWLWSWFWVRKPWRFGGVPCTGRGVILDPGPVHSTTPKNRNIVCVCVFWWCEITIILMVDCWQWSWLWVRKPWRFGGVPCTGRGVILAHGPVHSTTPE